MDNSTLKIRDIWQPSSSAQTLGIFLIDTLEIRTIILVFWSSHDHLVILLCSLHWYDYEKYVYNPNCTIHKNRVRFFPDKVLEASS